jgi:hypothetical protein
MMRFFVCCHYRVVLSGILDSVCKYVRINLYQQTPGCLICCIRSVEQILGGCVAEKNSLNQTRF